MGKIWKKVLDSIWKSDRTLTIKEISEDTGLKLSQISRAIPELRHMELIKTEKKWKMDNGIPRSHIEIMINQNKESSIRRILENDN